MTVCVFVAENTLIECSGQRTLVGSLFHALMFCVCLCPGFMWSLCCVRLVPIVTTITIYRAHCLGYCLSPFCTQVLVRCCGLAIAIFVVLASLLCDTGICDICT